MHAGATWRPAPPCPPLSAALFAGNSVAVRLALAGTTATTIVVVSILTNLTTLWVVAALRGEVSAALQPAALIFVGAGGLAPGLARIALYTAIDMVGEARAGRLVLLLALSPAVLAAASIVFRKIGLGMIPHAALAGGLTLSGAILGLVPLVVWRWGGGPIRAAPRG